MKKCVNSLVLGAAGLAIAAVNPVAAASASGDPYLQQLRHESVELSMLKNPTAVDTSGTDREAVMAARLGVSMPVGRAALEAELRSYYPGAYRTYRGLDSEQTRQLWQVFDQTGSAIRVLEEMDALVVR